MTLPHARGVTLVAITSVALEATLAALRHSLAQLGFDRALLLSDTCPEGLGDAGIEWRWINRLGSRRDYSRFVLHELADHIDTSHALLVQWDGFVRNGSGWNETFLDYDYIGAVWPQFDDEHKVGNGGFSLRSQRLLRATRVIEPGDEPEDVAICRKYRHRLEEINDMKFADLAIARQFSYERETRSGAEFGFHGAFNLFAELPREQLRWLLRSLEPGILGRIESVEVFFEAMTRLDLEIARPAFSQVLAHDEVVSRLFRGARRRYFDRRTQDGRTLAGKKANGH